MVGVVIFFFLIFIFWRLFFKPKKDKPIDMSKDSDYYIKKYPDILKPIPPTQDKDPNVTININVTHNHLHVYPPGEEKD